MNARRTLANLHPSAVRAVLQRGSAEGWGRSLDAVRNRVGSGPVRAQALAKLNDAPGSTETSTERPPCTTVFPGTRHPAPAGKARRHHQGQQNHAVTVRQPDARCDEFLSRHVQRRPRFGGEAAPPPDIGNAFGPRSEASDENQTHRRSVRCNQLRPGQRSGRCWPIAGTWRSGGDGEQPPDAAVRVAPSPRPT